MIIPPGIMNHRQSIQIFKSLSLKPLLNHQNVSTKLAKQKSQAVMYKAPAPPPLIHFKEVWLKNKETNLNPPIDLCNSSPSPHLPTSGRTW